jgi:hypothetical protein
MVETCSVSKKNIALTVEIHIVTIITLNEEKCVPQEGPWKTVPQWGTVLNKNFHVLQKNDQCWRKF